MRHLHCSLLRPLCIALALVALPHAYAQREAALYDFNDLKYKVSSWPMNEQMHVLIEKYGAEFAQHQRDIDSLLTRLNGEAWKADVQEMNDPATMPPVRKLLGYYDGMNARNYSALVVLVKEKKTVKVDSVLTLLLDSAVKDTSALTNSLKVVADLTKHIDSLARWMKLPDATRRTAPLQQVVDKLSKNTRDSLMRACPTASVDTCKTNLKKVLDKGKTTLEERFSKVRVAIATMKGKGQAMVDGYQKTVDDRTTELRKFYAAQPAALDSLKKACSDPKSDGCAAMKKKIETKLKEEKDTVSREFTIALPMSDNRDFFVETFSDALMGLSKAEASKKGEADRLAEVNFYRLLTIILSSPTPDAGELCVNRELKVYRRKTSTQVWLERRARYASKAHPGILIAGRRSGLVEKDSLIAIELKKVNKDGKSTWEQWQKIEDRVHDMPRLRARFKTDHVSDPHTLAIVRREKYERRHTPHRLRHHTMSATSLMAIDQHDQFRFSVEKVSIKFEDGVIDEIVVSGTIEETFRFLLVPDGTTGHNDSLFVPHHYQKHPGEILDSTTRCTNVTFTNSNTPIPFGNVWNFYERFMDHMPLYGYANGSGVQYHGTSEPDYVLMLSDLIHYDPALQKATNNIAPGDTIVNIDFSERSKVDQSAPRTAPEDGCTACPAGCAKDPTDAPCQLCAGLKKDDLRKIGEFRVYSDLVGLARDQPNGLIQTDYSWKLPLWPRKHQGVNFLTYVEPAFNLVLREEEEQRAYMGIDTVSRDPDVKLPASPTDLLPNATYNVGMKLTITQLSLRYLKSEIELNGFGLYHRTQARDSVFGTVSDSTFVDSISTWEPFTRTGLVARDIPGIGSFTYGGEIRWRMRPDGRFGFDLYGGLAWHSILDTRYGLHGTGWEPQGSWSPNMVFAGLDAHLFANPSQKFFFKFRWVANRYAVDDNFVQLLFGYSRNLKFARSEEEKQKEQN